MKRMSPTHRPKTFVANSYQFLTSSMRKFQLPGFSQLTKPQPCWSSLTRWHHMEVSINGGTPSYHPNCHAIFPKTKPSILDILGTPMAMETPISRNTLASRRRRTLLAVCPLLSAGFATGACEVFQPPRPFRTAIGVCSKELRHISTIFKTFQPVPIGAPL